MKTILINKTLTTIALISSIQSGYGTTKTISSWSNLMSRTNSTEDPTNTYTLNKYSAYNLNMTSAYLTQDIKLIIPSGVEVTNSNYMYVDSNLEIENNGIILNNDNAGYIQASASDSSIIFSGSGTITNNCSIVTSGENSSITFSGSGDINNDAWIETNAANSSITFSGTRTITNNSMIVTSAENSSITFSGSGDINNDGWIGTNAANSSITFSGSGTITNNDCIWTDAASSSITFSGSGTITNNDHISTPEANSSITFSGSGTITNNCSIVTSAENSRITFSGTRTINNYSNGDRYTGIYTLSDSVIEFTGKSQVNNNGTIYTWESGGSIVFSGGDADNKQIVTTSGTSSKPGKIYLDDADSSMTIGQYSILSFGDYGKFYGTKDDENDILSNVTLNGTIEIASINASVDTTNINFFPGGDKDSNGTIDMSPLRPYSADNTALTTFENHDFFTFGASQQLPNIKLPFNCKFNSIDLSNAAKVFYTVLKIIDGVEIDDNNVIKGNVIAKHGDYADSNNSLGVTLPKTNGVIDTSKIHIENKYAGSMSLSDLVSEMDGDQLKYNKIIYKLYTTDLTDATDTITSNATRTYNFGFIGTTPIEISGNGKAIFNGDNSGYEVAPTISVSEVEFGANDSLFQFTKTYVRGTFSAGNYTNTIPSGKTITFTGGFTVGAGHTLIVRGTLIG